jgi:hypothetical protein
MADAPGTPPNNPNLTDAVNQMNNVQEKTTIIAGKFEEILNRIEQRSDDISKRFKNVNLELTTAVELASSTEEAIKEIVDASKKLRKGIIDTKSSKDALVTVRAIRDAQEILLKRTKDMPVAQAKIGRSIQDLNRRMVELQHTTEELTDVQIRDLNLALHETSKEVETIAKNFKTMSVSHLSRQLGGITGALQKVGIGKQFGARVEKYQGLVGVAGQIREAQKARFEGNKDMFKDKREAALKAVQQKYGFDMSDPKALRMAGKGNRQAAQAELADKLGISTKGLKQADMIALAGGKETSASAAIAGRYHGTGATGVASKAATGVENGLIQLTTALGENAIYLAAVEGAVMALVAAFDTYVAQNKAMESGLAKGGLFTTGAGGRGFSGARAGLTPGDALTRLGTSFDRNLKIAQTIAESGYDIADIVKAGDEEQLTGNKVVGKAGEGFMAGGSGMIQRAAMGAGRIAGLTDAEGVQRVIKLMEEYRETLEQGENFFIQVGKGAKNAGLSTTKYISIIDEVLGRFDRMNRSLDSTVTVMGELSKSGRLASEDLSQYFKFLTGGAGSQEAAGSSEQIFLLNRMSGSAKTNLASQQKQLMDNLVDRAAGKGNKMGELSIPGISQAQIRKGFGGSAQEMDDFVTNVMQPAIATAQVDDKTKKSWNNLVEQMRSQKQQAETADSFAKGKIDAVGYGLGSKVGGTNMQMSMALQQGAMDMILKSGKWSDFKKNPMEFAAQHKEVSFLAELFKNDPKSLQNLPRVMEIAGQMRLREGQAGAKDDELYKLAVKNGFKVDIKNPSAYKKYLMEHGNELLNELDGLKSTFGYFGKASVQATTEASEGERQAALEEAKKAGAQTQTLGDVIAHAFSKWFNNIISGLEAIVDLMPGSDKNARAQRKADSDAYLSPTGSHAKDTTYAVETLQEQIAEQTDLADKANIAGDKKAEEFHKKNAAVYQDSMDRIQASLSAGTFFGGADEDYFRNFMNMNTGLVGSQTRKRIAAERQAGGSLGGNIDNSQTTIITTDASQAPTQKPVTGSSSEKVNKKKQKVPVVTTTTF